LFPGVDSALNTVVPLQIKIDFADAIGDTRKTIGSRDFPLMKERVFVLFVRYLWLILGIAFGW